MRLLHHPSVPRLSEPYSGVLEALEKYYLYIVSIESNDDARAHFSFCNLGLNAM